MKDCRKKIITFDSKDITDIPCVGLGTYGVNINDLLALLAEYPFKNLLLDTASKYANEDVIGEVIKRLLIKRENMFLVSKISYEQQEYNDVKRALSETLVNLQVDNIDLYLIHSPRHQKRVDTWKQMIQMREMGLVKSIGVSNFTISQIDELYINSGVFPSVNQVVFNIIPEAEANELIEYCRKNNIILQDAQPFGGKSNAYHYEYCYDRLKKNFEKNIISIIGTTNKEHLYEDFYPFLEKDV